MMDCSFHWCSLIEHLPSVVKKKELFISKRKNLKKIINTLIIHEALWALKTVFTVLNVNMPGSTLARQKRPLNIEIGEYIYI